MGKITSNWKETKNRFINPYNFIPLEESVTRDTFQCGNLVTNTGYLDCIMEFLTPVIIPNTSNSRALHTKLEMEDKKYAQTSSFDFFSYEDLSVYEGNIDKTFEPVIPGSEIRGAVRSVYEAAFNSCMSAVSEDRRLGRRTSKPKKPGILEYTENGWFLYPCERWRLLVNGINNKESKDNSRYKVELSQYNSWKEGERLFVKKRIPYSKSKTNNLSAPMINDCITGNEARCPDGWIEGFLHKGEPYPKKCYESVFIKKNNKGIRVSATDIEALNWALDEYSNDKKNLHKKKGEHGGYDHYKVDIKKRLPVYYYEENGVPLYLSPACIGKEISDLTLGDLLRRRGGYQPCEDVRSICPSCSLFGMVSGKPGKEEALASRIRFTDALVKNRKEKGREKDYYMPPIVLPELGEPKPGAAEFYTNIPVKDAKSIGWNDSRGYWTYDYYCARDPQNKKLIKRIKYLPEIRGRKYYWHHDVSNEIIEDKKEMSEMRQRVRPLKAKNGTLFAFRIYFDNISEQELSQLIWALDFNSKSCAHKIGRAKPLGFGSAKIHVNHVCCRVINEETGVWQLEKKDPDLFRGEVKITKIVKETLLAMADWNNRPNSDLVRYPLADIKDNSKNSNSSHQWFNGNKSISSESLNMQPVFSKVLPDALEEAGSNNNQWLYKLVNIDERKK